MTRAILSYIILLYALCGQCQPGQNYFKLQFTNNSKHTSTCNILGIDKIDSILPNQTKTILFNLPPDQISFYLNLSTTDLSNNSYKNKLIRILNTEKSKHIVADNNNQLKIQIPESEKIVADFNPQLRTKNFWKLDTIIKNNSNDIAAAEIIFLSLCDIDIKTDTISKYFNFLKQKVKASAFGQRIKNYLTARGRLNTGSKIDNFIFPDTSGKMLSLDKINSDYVLLDFWFSRCTPCIKSFPELQAIYSKTERKQFEIIGISVDTKEEKELWVKTIKKYDLPWININDVNYSLSKKYVIVNYPTKILLDKNRKILLVDTDNSGNFYEQVLKIVNGQ